MSYLKDYKAIKKIIDEIIGVDTLSGNNLKMAVKNYFETKPISVKFNDNKSYTSNYKVIKTSNTRDVKMEEAMNRFSKKIRERTKNLKKRGKFRGIEFQKKANN